MQKMQSRPEWQKTENACSTWAWNVKKARFQDNASRWCFAKIGANTLVFSSDVEFILYVTIDRMAVEGANYIAQLELGWHFEFCALVDHDLNAVRLICFYFK